MKQAVNLHDFRDAFRQYGRTDNFSHLGLEALFEHLEQYEEECGTEIELDVIALCCEFSEYSSALEAAHEYRWKPDSDETEEEREESALEWLRDRTQVIEFEGGVIIQDF